MPVYDYRCATCGRGREVILRLAELDSAVVNCQNCQFPMNRQISAPAIVADYPGYTSPTTGRWIEGRQAHREELARTGCRVFESGEKEEFLRRKAQREREFDKAIDETADELLATMPSDKRDKLTAELDNGLDVQVTRTSPT